MTTPQDEKLEQNLHTLANATELVAQVVLHSTSGTNYTNLNGSPMTLGAVRDIATQRFQQHLRLTNQ